MLLLNIHGHGVLVGIAVEASVDFSATSKSIKKKSDPVHLMTGISDHCTFFWESLQGVPWDKPCSLDLVLCEQLQKPTDSNGASEEAFAES